MSDRPLDVAVVIVLPDLGHVIPLLRIAVALQRAGHSVTCFLPEECFGIAEEYGVSFVSLGNFQSNERTEASAKHDDESLFLYWEALCFSMRRSFSAFYERVKASSPVLLVADAHIFGPWYRELAHRLGVPLVLHRSEGTLRAWQSPFLFHYGISTAAPPWLQTFMSAVYSRALASRYETRQRRETAMVQRLIDATTGSIHESAPTTTDAKPNFISTGLGRLEAERLRSYLRPADEPNQIFGPLSFAPKMELSTSLRRWMESLGNRPLIYVSFGSMMRASRAQIRKLVRAAESLEIAVLWSLPNNDQALMANFRFPDWIRFESRVPQRTVMELPQVKLVVTHGGAGTVQEALLAAKPLLCMPVMWDQFYNSSVVEKLGVGKQLRWRRASPKKLRATLGELLHDGSYREKVDDLQRTLRDQQGDRAVVEHLETIVRDKKR